MGGIALAETTGTADHDKLFVGEAKRGVEEPYETRLVDVLSFDDSRKPLVSRIDVASHILPPNHAASARSQCATPSPRNTTTA